MALGEVPVFLGSQRVDGPHPAQLCLQGLQRLGVLESLLRLGCRGGQSLGFGGVGVAAEPLGDGLLP